VHLPGEADRDDLRMMRIRQGAPNGINRGSPPSLRVLFRSSGNWPFDGIPSARFTQNPAVNKIGDHSFHGACTEIDAD
jgi:hypothetical protein